MGDAAASNDYENKRTFEMKKENLKDFKWALGLNQLGAELLGVWPNESREKSEPWHVRLRVLFMVILIFFWLCVPQTWALLLVINNLPLFIDNLLTNTVAFSGSIKLFFLWRNKKVMQPVVESARMDWLRTKSASERQLMLNNASDMRLVTIVDYTVTALSFVAFIIFPVLNIEMRLINNITDRGDRHLLVQSYYPFDFWRSPYFELTQALQYLSGAFAGLTITVPENYYGALVIHLSGQFDLLALELERFFYRQVTSSAYKIRLASLIRRHVHLIAMINALECSFTYVTLAQVFSTSMMLCSSGFQVLSIVDSSSEQLPLLQMVALSAFIITFMLHTLVDCAVGETLTTRSTTLVDSIYKCRWYAVDGKRARDLIPMMIASRNQRPLTAGKILPLSLATYCSILKTTAGYISMLVTVNTK